MKKLAIIAGAVGVAATAALLLLFPQQSVTARLWHQYGLRHRVTFHPKLKPDRRMGSIAVYEQRAGEFRIPMAHHECDCGEVFI